HGTGPAAADPPSAAGRLRLPQGAPPACGAAGRRGDRRGGRRGHGPEPDRAALTAGPGRPAPRRTAPHRNAPHRNAPHRTAPHRTSRLSDSVPFLAESEEHTYEL